jgi:hypothetical protein
LRFALRSSVAPSVASASIVMAAAHVRTRALVAAARGLGNALPSGPNPRATRRSG